MGEWLIYLHGLSVEFGKIILNLWIKMMNVIPSTVIAGIAVYIAYQQYNMNKNHFRLALFDKRFKVYEGVMKFLAQIFHGGKVKESDYQDFRWNTKDIVLLFGDEMKDYIQEIGKNALELQAINEGFNTGLLVGDEFKENRRKHLELITWFTEQHSIAVDKFREYMQFK